VGLERITPKYTYIYARTKRRYNERGSRINYVRSSITYYIYKTVQLKPRIQQPGTCLSMTARSPLLSPSSTLPPSFSHCCFHFVQVKMPRIADMYYFIFTAFLKARNSEIAPRMFTWLLDIGEVCSSLPRVCVFFSRLAVPSVN
jgi:hypothetical protein